MGNIDTYIKDIGRLPFDREPFNDVDNLIISYLVYYDFRGIVPTPGQKRSIPAAEAAAMHKALVGDAQAQVHPAFLEDLGASVRFGCVRLSDRIDLFRKSGTQFSALCVTLPDDTPFFVFRGVDSTVTGWEEAFKISYRETPAQKMAAAYLQRVLPVRLERTEGPAETKKGFLLGGHSKGGNLALYAAVHLEKPYRDAVRMIYQNDALGMAPGTYDPKILQEYEGRITRIAPQYAVVDGIYKQSPPDRIVRANIEGRLQHNPYYWTVEGRDLVDADASDPEAQKLQSMLNKWLAAMTAEESRHFVLHIFAVLQRELDAGRPIRVSNTREFVHMFRLVWTGAAPPARRAILRLIEAAAEAAMEHRKHHDRQ